MTLEQLQSNFQVLVSEFPYSTYTATVLSWFNEGQRKICEKRLISDKATTPSIAETGEYDLPDNFIETKRGGVFFNDELITPATLPLLVNIYGEDWKSTESGTPKYYLIDGGSIELIPKPSIADLDILLNFWAYANDLSSSSDVPFTTGNESVGYTKNNRLRGLDDLLLEYAIGMAKFSLGFYDTTQQALNNFYSLLNQRVVALRKSGDLEYNEKMIDPYHLRNLQRRINGNT